MKLKKIRVPEFKYVDEFGKITIPNVEVLINPSENDVSAEDFDQNKHDFHLSSEEIDRLSKISAQRFYDDNIKKIMNDKKTLSETEISGIKEILKVNASELGDLIGLDKSSISRLLSGKQEPQPDKMMLLMERLREELEHPGKSRITLGSLATNSKKKRNIENVCLPAVLIAQYFIRRFLKTESPITHLKLQKLLYYAQGVGFGRADIKLFEEPLLAWEHGPVVREVYDVYHKFESRPLPVDENVNLSALEENENALNVLDETISLYGLYEAWHLREKTHKEKPWLLSERNSVITDDVMISYFKSILV